MSEKEFEERKQKIRELYRYDEMSNKVLKADRSLQTNRSDPLKDAAKSHPKTMSGRISVKDMGGDAHRAVADDEKEKVRKEMEARSLQVQKRRANQRFSKRSNFKNATILESDTLEQLRYYPTNEMNNQVYENIVRWVSELLGNDIPHNIILSATDLILQILKENEDEDDGVIENKKKIIETDLSISIKSNSFHELVNLSKSITDYHDQNGDNGANNDGVAILVDEDEDDEEREENTLLDEEEEEEEIDEEQDIDVNEASVEKLSRSASREDVQNKDEVINISNNDSILKKHVEEIPIYLVDEIFLQRKLSSELKEIDSSSIQDLAQKILLALSEANDSKWLENQIMGYLDFENYAVAEFIVKNRLSILWGIRLSRASDVEKQELLQEMLNIGLEELVNQYKNRSFTEKRRLSNASEEEHLESNQKRKKKNTSLDAPQLIRLDNLTFDQGSRLMTTTKITLPQDSFKRVKKTYEEIHVPPPVRSNDEFPLVEISTLPQWARKAFPTSETKTLNRVQSEVYESAFKNDFNILLCAPTGAGKTNVAMLAILRAMFHFYNEEKGSFELSKFKLVYIAPLKALVQEQVRELQRRLDQFGVKVAELTGDSNLTRQQILETQVLVSTPEKWDVVTRKNSDTSYTKLVRLIIIDEVHLLHDERGPVLESIVARTIREQDSENPVRLVALSATLPNYDDVAKFLRVPKQGLFYFDSSFRPCPLAQQYCGVTEKNTFKKLNAMNEVCYDKILEAANGNHQVIIFVHSRKDTARTATWLKEKLIEDEKINLFAKSDPGSKEILKQESENVQDTSLKDLIMHGFGIHHAGLSRGDRALSEDLFADGLIQVLVSTATLAWGVNLPAHTVIIKGTEIYSPQKGDWTQLSPQDVLQMLGRAGRPRYDTNGEGIIITNQSEVQYYLAVLNQQLPIESQFMSKIADNLNAEVVLGSVKTRKEAIDWLGYTYLYIRMLKDPVLYKVINERHPEDNTLYYYREDLAHSALQILHDNNLIVYDKANGTIISTELGRIASHFYIKYDSIAMYNKNLNEFISQIDLLRIFAMSDEFKNISVRQEEKNEIEKLLEKAPIPIKETADEALAKTNVLLQAYVSRLKLDGFALNADMVYITQSAGRLFRAIFEICLKKGWPRPSKMLLNLCKSVEKRMWLTNSPFRQFPRCPLDIIKRTEASSLPWNEYFNLSTPAEVGQAIRSEKNGKLAYDLLQKFPRLQMKCSMQPITKSLLKFDLEILPEWVWDSRLHGYAESFTVMVEDTNGEKILYTDHLVIKKNYIGQEHYLDFTIQLDSTQQEQLPPNFFITLISDKWLHCDYKVPVIFDDVQLPKRFPAPTPLLDVTLTPVSELENPAFSSTFNFETFNKFQTQTFQALYNTNENVLVGASKGAGKTVMAELAILNHWRQNKGRAVYICPSAEKLEKLEKNWNKRFSQLAGGKNINILGLELTQNLRLLAESHLILATPEQFDLISRRWKQRKNVQKIELLILDDAHEISNGTKGAAYENIISRMIFISAQLETDLRIVGLSTSLANGRDFGEWIGVKKNNIFNFSSQEKIGPLKIHLQCFTNTHNPSLIQTMMKSSFKTILDSANESETAIVFVPTRRHCVELSIQIMRLAALEKVDLLRVEQEDLEAYLEKVTDPNLKHALKHGIGFIHSGMMPGDRKIVEKLHEYKAIPFLLVTKECCSTSPNADTVVILSTQYYEGREHRYVDYPVHDILEMVGVATCENENGFGKVIIMTNPNKKDYYRKFLSESLPVESFMYFYLHDAFCNEISTSIIQSKQDCIDWITYTYFYRRIHANPSFYGVKDTSPLGISAYLTELVEETLKDLTDASMIEVEEEEESQEDVISPLNGSLISSYHNVPFPSMHTFMLSLSKSSNMKAILEILSSASVFESIPIRREDSSTLSKLHNRVPLKFSVTANLESTAFKTFVLLQAYFSRLKLPQDLEIDLKEILKKSVPLVNAIVDILSGEGNLNATTAMDVSQMLIQGVWDTDSPLKQVPCFNSQILNKCVEKNIETVYDIMSLEDEEREEIINLNNKEMYRVANFVNSYPNVELQYAIDLSDPIISNEPKSIVVTLARDDEPESLEVVSDKFPFKKTENWWIVIGEASSKQLHSIRRVTLKEESQNYTLDVTIPEPGHHKLSIWCICDSYLDADKEVSFEVDVQKEADNDTPEH